MCMALSKSLLVVINVSFFVAGALLAVLGGLAKFNQDLILKLFDIIPGDVVDDISQGWDLPTFLDSAGLIIMIVGISLFIIGFCGCCGGLRESQCLLGIYMVIVFLIFAGEITAIVLIYVKADEVGEKVQEVLRANIKDEYTDSEGGFFFNDGLPKLATDPAKLAWDTTQVLIGCCGVTNFTDYAAFSGDYVLPDNGSVNSAIVPITCCNYVSEKTYQVLKTKQNTTTPTNTTGAQHCLNSAAADHTRSPGCYTSLRELLDEYQLIVAAVLGGIVAIELIGFISACCVIRQRDSVDNM